MNALGLRKIPRMNGDIRTLNETRMESVGTTMARTMEDSINFIKKLIRPLGFRPAPYSLFNLRKILSKTKNLILKMDKSGVYCIS